MKYLTRSTGFAEEFCNNEKAMSLFGESALVDDTVLNSDLWVDAIKASPYKNYVLPYAELVEGQYYNFGGYEWIVAELNKTSGYAVLQSTGVTSGNWPGFKMSKFGGSANKYYLSNIDGQDISGYDTKMTNLYNSIKAAEKTGASYGSGLYLVSNAKAGTTSSGSQGSGNYWSALKTAATKHDSFGATTNDFSWLGTVCRSYDAWSVYYDGTVSGGSYNQENPFVVAPAFNLDLCMIKLNGNTMEAI